MNAAIQLVNEKLLRLKQEYAVKESELRANTQTRDNLNDVIARNNAVLQRLQGAIANLKELQAELEKLKESSQ